MKRAYLKRKRKKTDKWFVLRKKKRDGASTTTSSGWSNAVSHAAQTSDDVAKSSFAHSTQNISVQIVPVNTELASETSRLKTSRGNVREQVVTTACVFLN